jgi:hypothetical protein
VNRCTHEYHIDTSSNNPDTYTHPRASTHIPFPSPLDAYGIHQTHLSRSPTLIPDLKPHVQSPRHYFIGLACIL